MGADFLHSMATASAARVRAARGRESEQALRRRALETRDPPQLRLHASGFDLIAEVKRVSPSSGSLRPGEDVDSGFVAHRADAYARGGAAAISILTEPDRFGGSLDDLTTASRAVSVPTMRKDFLVDPYQVFEARAAGAGGVLAIARMLDENRMRELLAAASEMGLFVLLEAFDEAELTLAARAVASADGVQPRILLGLNARDLTTLEVDAARLQRIPDGVPTHLPLVAESGLESADAIRQVARAGYRAALVGTALMRAEDPARLTASWIVVGREEAMKRCGSA